jgi:hypothetical protein
LFIEKPIAVNATTKIQHATMIKLFFIVLLF